MNEEDEIDVRQLLDSEDDWGLLTALVLEEHDKEQEPVDMERAKRNYIQAGCPSMVYIIEWSERHPKKELLIWSSLCVKMVTAEGEHVGDITGDLEIGLPVMGISPRLWLCYLAARVHELTERDRSVVEGICNDLALMQENQEAQRRASSWRN